MQDASGSQPAAEVGEIEDAFKWLSTREGRNFIDIRKLDFKYLRREKLYSAKIYKSAGLWPSVKRREDRDEGLGIYD